MKRLILLPFLLLQAAACDDDRSTGPAPVPTAAFTVSGTLQAGQPARFDAAASADPGGGGLSYNWSFGDGTHGGTREIAHLYAQGGAFAVQLTVRDAQDRTASATQTVTIAPGPAATGTATLAGRVTLPDGTPLAGVAVAVAGTSVTAQTAADGSVTLPPVPAGVPLALRLARAGYADGTVRVEALANGSSYGWFQAALALRAPAGVLASAQAGGTVAGPAGAQVVFPAAGLVRADGTPATGPVDVAITPVDVVNAVDAFPGPFSGVQADGTSTPIATFGVMEIDVSQGGQPLQIAPGRTATLEIPIYTGGAAAGQTIPLWSLDEAQGMWVQEGTGTVVASAASPGGLALRATVSHLSWWNVDIPYAPATVNVACFTQASPTPVPLTAPCWVRARQEAGSHPRVSSTILLPAGARVSLPLFPGVATRIYGTSTANPAVTGDVLVTQAGGSSQNVDVVIPVTPSVVPAEIIVGGGIGAKTMSAFNGTQWLNVLSPFSDPNGYGSVYAVAWNGSMWVAGGQSISGPPLASSATGYTWNPSGVGLGIYKVYGVGWNGSQWAAVGDGATGPLFLTSNDGIAWTHATSFPGAGGGMGAPGGGRFVAWSGSYWLAGTTAGLVSSLNGSVWTTVPSPVVSAKAGAWNGTRWVVVGSGAGGQVAATSLNGTTWSAQPLALADANAVAWNGTYWLAGGVNSVASSANGTTWTVTSGVGIYVHDLAWTGTQWVAAGINMGSGMVSTSVNGTAWTQVANPFTTQGYAAAYRRAPYPPLP